MERRPPIDHALFDRLLSDRALLDRALLERARVRGRTSLRARLARWRARRWAVVQCAVAAGVAWWVADDVLGHTQPFLAPVAAVLCLGTSYGQRLRRVLEVMIGVAVGVLVADLLVAGIGNGPWQLALIVVLAMSAALVLDGGQLLVNQSAVQAITVSVLLPGAQGGFLRWTDAVIGGLVALVAATVVPRAALRRPQQQAAVVVRKIAAVLRGTSEVMASGDAERAFDLLAEVRRTDPLVRDLQDAAAEGLSLVASSPFRRRHRHDVRAVSDLVDPVDKALRSTRVLVRRTAIAAHHHRDVPASYPALVADLAVAADAVAAELAANRLPDAARPAVQAVADATAHLERTEHLAVEVVLAQLRSVVADLLEVTGLPPLDASDALPPVAPS